MISDNIIIDPEFGWTDLEDPQLANIDFIEDEYGLSPLLVYDCLLPDQLPKFEHTQGNFFFLLRTYVRGQTGPLSVPGLTNKLAIFVQGNSVVTIHKGQILPLKKITELRSDAGFPKDVHTLVHQLFRVVTLSFSSAISELEESYDAFEQSVLAQHPASLERVRVFEFRRKLHIHKSVIQLTQQAVYNSREFWRHHSHLQQDIRENLDQVYFELNSLGHNFDNLFSMSIAITDQKNNDVTKVLTIFASVMLPLTFISSFYGMNFDRLPGLRTTGGLVAVVVLMVSTAFLTFWFFYRKNWFSSGD